MDLIKIAEEAFATPKKQFDEFGPGDTITVAYRIKEGNKERIQQYRGVVIRISGRIRSVSLSVRFLTVSVWSVYSPSSPPSSRASPSISTVRCVVPNSIIFVA